MTEKKLPRFTGKPLIRIEIPELEVFYGEEWELTPRTRTRSRYIKQIGFLREDFGKAFLKEYQGIVQNDYNGNRVLDVFRYDSAEDVVKGSGLFAVVLANQLLKEEGFRTATLADLGKVGRISYQSWVARRHSDLEKALQMVTLDLSFNNVFTGLVLRSGEEDYPVHSKNAYLARDLLKQIKARNPEQELPVMISLSDLRLRIDSDSGYGLAFDLAEDAEIIYAWILSIFKQKEVEFSWEAVDEKTGLPKKIGGGYVTLHMRSKSGLSGMYLDSFFHLYSDDKNLADSFSSSGMVVVVEE